MPGIAQNSLTAVLLLLFAQAAPAAAPAFLPEPTSAPAPAPAPVQTRSPTPKLIASIAALTTLTNDEATGSIPLAFEATVTFLRPTEKNLFVMDGDFGCYVRWPVEQGLRPGDRVRITGYTAPSFRPIAVARTVTFLSHGELPPAPPADFADLIQSKWDSRRIVVSGRVLSAALDDSKPERSLRVRVKVPNGTVEGIIAHPGPLRTGDLLEADVRMTGVAGGDYDSKMQMAGVWLDLNSNADLVILHKPAIDPWTVPTVPMENVIGAYRFGNLSHRVRVTGTLTYYEPGTLAVVQQQGGLSMVARTNTTDVLHSGSPVEVTGFPAVVDHMVRLENAQLRAIPAIPAAQPNAVHWDDASIGMYAYDLVSLEGEVVGVVHDARVDLFIILSEGHLFSATLHHASIDAAAVPGSAKAIPIGSRVRVTGVCFVDAGNHWRDRLWFDIRMRSLQDVVTLRPPSLWTVKHLAYVISFLSLAILASVLWAGRLERRLRAKTAALAHQSQEEAVRQRASARLEKQRSHILELISSSVPLVEILHEIESMVSSRLSGAACWFELSQLAGGSTHAHHSADPDSATPQLDDPHRLEPGAISHELVSHEGLALGLLLTRPQWVDANPADTQAALTTGARLAELAIETRRLYSDLRHRSEHDLLTDIPNRFSMERHLDALMERAARNEGIFGLIYVDLDRFKEINDRFGHRIGDLYLQSVSRRMRLQLRNNDILARIGGDEFIALVPILRSRSDAEEIAVRLERCFDEPFQLDGYVIHGAASVGLAIYPEDGDSQQALQHAADAAMYAHKQSKRSIEPRQIAHPSHS